MSNLPAGPAGPKAREELYESPCRVLAVDDNPIMLRAINRLLGETCYVMTASDGEDALSKLKYFGPFSVVVADHRMPGYSGVELIDRVKEISPATNCIMLTAHASDPGIKEQLSNGLMHRLLVKPCPIDDILDAVHSADRAYQAARPQIAVAD